MLLAEPVCLLQERRRRELGRRVWQGRVGEWRVRGLQRRVCWVCWVQRQEYLKKQRVRLSATCTFMSSEIGVKRSEGGIVDGIVLVESWAEGVPWTP